MITTTGNSVRLLFLLSISLLGAKPRAEAPRACAFSNSNLERSTARTGLSIPADESLASTILEELESRLSRLERRLRAVEQPVWQMGSAEEDWEICAEGPCRCLPEIKSVSCWRQDLLDLPAAQLVPRDVFKLDLGGNRLTALHRDTFLDMTRLNHLDISENSIEHLPLNLFFSLHAVTHVRLSKNQLRELHRSQFFSTRNLRILDASSNKIRTLPESLFLSTTSLVLLDLSCNRISTLSPGTFGGLSALEELLLGKNRLSILPADLFSDLASLKYLGLEENRLKDLPSDLFHEQTSLRELNMGGNQLTEISGGLLSSLEELRSLEMSNNKISRIDSSAFRGLEALKELQLGHNRLRDLPPGLFSTCNSLERLVLHANGLETLSRGAFTGLSNLTSLFLHSNHLRTLYSELFQGTPNLRKLQLESNYLTSLPPRILDPMPYIEQLRLARNPWHCDCAASYLAVWLQGRYLARTNESQATEDLSLWEFGAGAVCRGPGTLGGKLLLRLTFHELCEGQWASMRGLVPRIPVDLAGASDHDDDPADSLSPRERVSEVWLECSSRGAMDAATSSTEETALELLKRLLCILEEEKVFDRSSSEPLVRFVQPEELQKQLDVELKEEPATKEAIELAMRQTIRFSVNTFSPNFHNQLYAGIDEYGLAGSWLTDVFNTSQYTYEVAPVFTIMERQVIEKSLELVGYPKLPEGDGILCPGGSTSNMYGMVLARYKKVPEVKTKGVAGLPPLACFTSEAGHYSITKGAHWLGLGTDHVYKVKCDGLGRMRPEVLKAAIAEARKQGHLPFFVNATCGTTVLGAFDPLPEIAAICQEEDLWLHVDACLGGTLLLSEKYRTRMTGIELSNSVAWNPHKMLGAPFQCSLFLVKGKNILHEANCAGARYLFQQDKHYDVAWDTGDKSIQCGRKVDGAKFWLMWKARGTKGLRRSVDIAMSAAEYFLQKIKIRQGFRLVLPTYESCNICFWYVPPSMRGLKETKDWWESLYRITARIKERMMVEGSLMVGYTPLSYNNTGNFFRMVVTCQPPPTEASMDYAVTKIEELAADL